MDDLSIKIRPSMHTPRYSHASVYYEGWLYAIGGYQNKLCERYNVQQRTWIAIPLLPTPASSYYNIGVVVCCDKLYVLGG
jgi:hypothetical protein